MSMLTENRARGLDELWDLRDVLYDAGPGLGLPLPLLRGLQRLLRSDVMSFIALDSTRCWCAFAQTVEADDCDEVTEPEAGVPLSDRPFWRHYWSSQPCHFPDTSGDLRAVTLRSDFVSTRQWRASPMYVDCLRPFDHELMLALPDGGPGRTLRLLAFRSGGPDFTEDDRFLMQLLRPHIATAYRQAIRQRACKQDPIADGGQPRALTARQCQVLALIRDGATNVAIGSRLGIAEGTVRKHVEHIHAALGVSSRAAAAAAAEDFV